MSQSLTLVFCGTPRFAVPTLRKLAETAFRIPLVVTQPDKPRGRGLELAASPVKQAAEELGLRTIQPDRIKTNDVFRTELSALKPDAIIVVGYGKIIPPWMIELPRFGNINLHASLLPKYRGAAPIQWAIASGESVTGVTTMRIDAGLDTGDILMQKEVAIGQEDTAETVAPKLAEVGADLMVETLRGLQAGTVHPVPQDHSKATLAPVLKKEDGLMGFQRTALEIWNRLRGFQPWPGAYTFFRGKHLEVHSARLAERASNTNPGELSVIGQDLFVTCGAGSTLQLLELQIEGKRRMSARDFVNGYRPNSGERLGS